MIKAMFRNDIIYDEVAFSSAFSPIPSAANILFKQVESPNQLILDVQGLTDGSSKVAQIFHKGRFFSVYNERVTLNNISPAKFGTWQIYMEIVKEEGEFFEGLKIAELIPADTEDIIYVPVATALITGTNPVQVDVKPYGETSLDAHVNSSTAHNASVIITPDSLIRRDKNGRASVQAGVDNSHISTVGQLNNAKAELTKLINDKANVNTASIRKAVNRTNIWTGSVNEGGNFTVSIDPREFHTVIAYVDAYSLRLVATPWSPLDEYLVMFGTYVTTSDTVAHVCLKLRQWGNAKQWRLESARRLNPTIDTSTTTVNKVKVLTKVNYNQQSTKVSLKALRGFGKDY